MAKDTSKKLTEGNPMRLILGFMIPVLIGMLFQQFYSLVDTVIVGKALGGQRPRCRWLHRFHHFPYHWFLQWCCQRICHPGCSAIRCRRPQES